MQQVNTGSARLRVILSNICHTGSWFRLGFPSVGEARMTYCLPRQLADGCQIAPAFICCAVSRVTAPAVFSSLNAKGRDSLHEVDVPDRVLVCTACGTCSIFTGKPPKLSMETVLRRTPDCLRRHQRAEMRVAFVSACNGCKLKCEFTDSRKSANRLPRRAIARRHACRLCAATGTVAPPLLDGRKSVASITCCLAGPAAVYLPLHSPHACARARSTAFDPAAVR